MSDLLTTYLTEQWPLLLLLLTGFVMGYALARRRLRRQKRKLRFSNNYFQGLNYLLNDQQDKALDIFVELVETDWETIDTSLALGTIFRRQGEIDKSIKLHQNLLARPSLPADYKSTVLNALAKDYLQAGWLDRAESLFKEVINDDEFREEAQQCLMSIYEREQEWQQAIQIAHRYAKRGDDRIHEMIAHYYCELSHQLKLQGDLKEAESLANQALGTDKNCSRASILLADIAIQRGRYQKAIRFLRQVEIQDSQMIPLVVDRLVMCYRNTSNLGKCLVYLQSIDNRYQDISIIPTLAKLMEEVYGLEDAIQYVSGAVLQRPSLRCLRSLIDLQGPISDAVIRLVPEVIESIADKQPAYQCCYCGYTANTHVWHCPSCHSWSSIQPKFY